MSAKVQTEAFNSKACTDFLAIIMKIRSLIKSLSLLLGASTLAFSQNQSPAYFTGGPLVYDDHVYQEGILSVRFAPAGNDLAMPIIALNSGQQLELSFDDLYEEFSDMSYTIYHCNADWTPSDLMRNDYSSNLADEYIQNFEYSLNTFIPYTNYKLSIPNQKVRLTKSGNYLLVIYRNNDKSQLVLSRRFMVYEEIVKVGALVKRATRVEKMQTHQEVDFEINHSNYAIPNPFTDLKVILMQNQRWDNSIDNLKPQFLQNAKLIYQYDDENTFAGGSEFRFFDLKNLFSLSMNVRKITQDSLFTAYLNPDITRGIENYSFINDINGQLRVRRLDAPNSDSEADYALVDFYLDYPQEISSKVYVFGELSDWKMLPQFELFYDNTRKAYRTQLLLKQGFYNYAYAIDDYTKSGSDLGFFEGNHWQTSNQYQILVYHREIGSRYDRLVGFAEISSDNL
ncbi:MAG: hypothetical protein DA405_12445 [Bacteroidetes bacterium]|nr:MAG: hypothetical protein DA405_12445 [Bacteroidota bacterium]